MPSKKTNAKPGMKRASGTARTFAAESKTPEGMRSRVRRQIATMCEELNTVAKCQGGKPDRRDTEALQEIREVQAVLEILRRCTFGDDPPRCRKLRSKWAAGAWPALESVIARETAAAHYRQLSKELEDSIIDRAPPNNFDVQSANLFASSIFARILLTRSPIRDHLRARWAGDDDLRSDDELALADRLLDLVSRIEKELPWRGQPRAKWKGEHLVREALIATAFPNVDRLYEKL